MTMTRSWMLKGLLVLLAMAGPGIAQVHAQSVEYVHTDALGSVVAITDAAGNVVERNEYEPYGHDLTGTKDGPGYTGHVSDAATGLSYMQQRYYDPDLGRFLSVDPVTADGNTGSNFNRYKYAANNPYRFTDPDGRLEKITGSHIRGNKFAGSRVGVIGPPSARAGDSKAESSNRESTTTSKSSDTTGTTVAATAIAGAKTAQAIVDPSLGTYSEAGAKKMGDFDGNGIIKRWSGATKAELTIARNVSRAGQFIGWAGVAFSTGELVSAVDTGDTVGQVTAGTNLTFGAVGMTPWGAPAGVAYGATSLIMQTPMGEALTASMVDGACSMSGNC